MRSSLMATVIRRVINAGSPLDSIKSLSQTSPSSTLISPSSSTWTKLAYSLGRVVPFRQSALRLLKKATRFWFLPLLTTLCLLYTSDAADDLLCVDLGG